QICSKLLSAACTEYIFLLPADFTFKVTHIFNHTDDFMVCMQCHRTCTRCNECRCWVWCCNNNLFTVRQHLTYVQCHVACTRRQVQNQVVQFTPLNFIKEARQHFTQHRSAPDDRCILFHEECHGYHLYTITFHRNDLFAFDCRLINNSHHI